MSNTNNTNTRKELFVYKECLKNHAAILGTTATDGCGEYMPPGDNVGPTYALHCSACGCHRNFHRKEVAEGGGGSHRRTLVASTRGRGCPSSLLTTPPQVYFKLENNNNNRGQQRVEMEFKKRQRTRFTKEQKVKMLEFANKAEWMIHKVDESLVQQFCQEVGIKRKVVKVWMHNNKHHFVNKTTQSSSTQ